VFEFRFAPFFHDREQHSERILSTIWPISVYDSKMDVPQVLRIVGRHPILDELTQQ
jgi:hypothetical protein